MRKVRLMKIAGIAVIAICGFVIFKAVSTNIFAQSLSESEIREKVNRQFGGEIVELVEASDRYEIELMQDSGIYTIVLDAKNGNIVSLEQTDAYVVETETPPAMDPDLYPNENEPSDEGTQSDGIGKEPSIVKEPAGKVSTGKEAAEKEKERNEREQTDKAGSGKAGTGSGKEGTQKEDTGNRDTVKENPSTPTKPSKPSNPVDPSPSDSTNSSGSGQPTRPDDSKQSSVPRITANEAAIIAVNEVGGEVDDIELEEINGSYYYLVEIEFEDEDDDDDLEAVVQIDSITGDVLSVTWDD